MTNCARVLEVILIINVNSFNRVLHPLLSMMALVIKGRLSDVLIDSQLLKLIIVYSETHPILGARRVLSFGNK